MPVVFTKNRSFFWLCIRDNADGSYNFIVSEGIRGVFEYHFPEFLRAAPKGWEQGSKNTFSLWIPLNNLWMVNIDNVAQWATFAGNQCIWLAGDGWLDFCIAADFNFSVSATYPWPRTTLGEAEYWLKYRRHELSEDTKKVHASNVSSAMLECYELLPLLCRHNEAQPTVISSIPDNGEHRKLAPALAWHISKQVNLPFLRPVLSTVKPPMKNLSETEKKAAWNRLLSTENATSLLRSDVAGKEIVVIDDLYQSGTTMQAYALYLKRLGALRVFGLVCVKSMRDSDNQ